MTSFAAPALASGRRMPNRWDGVAMLLVMGLLIGLVDVGRSTLFTPLAANQTATIHLDPSYLPFYALRTTARMFAALFCSLFFTFTFATLAAKSRRAGLILIPILDILQSVPILGFLSFTVVFFLNLFPGRVFGAELACIFAIFTSQAWNMAFSFYQSLRTVPEELTEAGRVFGLTGCARFWRIEAPFGMPALIWNMMMSMSGGWFFVTISEAISVGNTNIALPGIGSYIAVAIAQKNLPAILYAILAMLVVILVYDQLMFRPLVAWADRFRTDSEQSEEAPQSWALTVYRRSSLLDLLTTPFEQMMRWSYHWHPPHFGRRAALPEGGSKLADYVWYAILTALGLYGAWRIWEFAHANLTLADLGQAFGLGVITMIRVLVLIALTSLVWTPIGVYVGMRPRLTQIVQPVAQFLAAFPANILFPLAVSLIVIFKLNPDIWLSPLMVLGTQWYILFNVIAGASVMPKELRDASDNFGVRGWLWWRKVALPAVFPYYVTGAITASGGSWNASIVAEVASWGTTTLHAHGLGGYIADAVTKGDFRKVVIGTAVMSFFVVVINRLIWRPLYWLAERKYKLT